MSFYVFRSRYVLKRGITSVQVINRVCFDNFPFFQHFSLATVRKPTRTMAFDRTKRFVEVATSVPAQMGPGTYDISDPSKPPRDMGNLQCTTSASFFCETCIRTCSVCHYVTQTTFHRQRLSIFERSQQADTRHTKRLA